MNQTVANNIAELSINKYNSLPKTGKPKSNEWTVLSTIVKEQNNTLEVVSLGTGSKCIGKRSMCSQGTILNDSHAEVMCRRGFLQYIYSKIGHCSDLFDFDEKCSKYSLKEDVRFHFFTTRVPCGDAAIFPKVNVEDVGDIIDEESEEVSSKRRKLIDTFRTGAKCVEGSELQDSKGQGIAYHVTGVVRTKPGRGDPTVSVSCSDKLAKWCHLGLQGALLMILLKNPLYLSRFIVLTDGSFNLQAFNRALFGRLENVELTAPFMQRQLEVCEVNTIFYFKKSCDKAPCPASIVWSANTKLEVAVNGRKLGATKKQYLTEKGRLKVCKLELFRIFKAKLQELDVTLDRDINNFSYRKAKQISQNYQTNWSNLKKSFGAWTKKEPTLEEFCTS